MSSNSFKPTDRYTPVTNAEKNISNTLRHCPGQSDQSTNYEISVSTLVELITRHSTLSKRDTSASYGEDEVDRFFEECLHEGDEDDDQAPENQVSFKDLEAFIVEIKKRFNCAPKKENSITINKMQKDFAPLYLDKH